MSRSTAVARPADLKLDQDAHIALSFLIRYQEPTRTNYEIALRQWFEFCAEHNVRPLHAKRQHIEAWIRHLEERRHLKASTICGKLNAVCGMYTLAERDHHIDESPGEYIRRPFVPKGSTRLALTRGELLRVLDEAKMYKKRDHALLCLLAYNGPRIGEALALDVEDLGMMAGYRTLYLEREKKNRSAAVPLAPRTSMAIDAYLGTRSTGPLFLNKYGERLDRKAAARIVARHVKAAGVTKHITPHSFRHTHITMALDAGVGLRDLQNSMGYADARQLAHYDRNKDSLYRNATHLVSAFVESA